jgi:glycosyltransferase involved in cell wall biosynthesis
MSAMLSTLTVVMPALNEEANIEAAIGSALHAFDQYGMAGELIVVNDGSRDRTAELVKRYMQRDARIRLIEHAVPMGIGASFWDGVRAAQHQFVTMFPGDNENDPEDALTYFHMTRDVDIIVPFIHNVEIRSLSRRVVSSIYRFIINMSFGMNLNYTNGTVIYNTAVIRQIVPRATGFFYQAEILIRLIRAGYLYAETPHFLSKRATGRTKALTLRSFIKVTREYLSLVWYVHVSRRLGETGNFIVPESATYRRLARLPAE